jgi:hypothetical protein
MILFGHEYFQKPPFYDVKSIEAILNTPPNSTLYIEFKPALLDVIEHCQLNKLTFALRVDNLKEAVFAHNFDASYLITTRIMAPTIQKAADTYLFDAKVLALITNEDEIQEIAVQGIDGAIFSNGIVKTTTIE